MFFISPWEVSPEGFYCLSLHLGNQANISPIPLGILLSATDPLSNIPREEHTFVFLKFHLTQLNRTSLHCNVNQTVFELVTLDACLAPLSSTMPISGNKSIQDLHLSQRSLLALLVLRRSVGTQSHTWLFLCFTKNTIL